jgi:membrane protein
VATEAATAETGRGRQAERPRDLPKAGWRDVLLRTKQEITNDHLSIVAAGVAFYALLALFPAIAAIIALWGLFFDAQQIAQQVESVSGMLPQEAAAIIESQTQKVASGAGGGVTLAAIGGLLLAIYSAAKGTKALMKGLNIVNDETESRGFLKFNLAALLLTLCGLGRGVTPKKPLGPERRSAARGSAASRRSVGE